MTTVPIQDLELVKNEDNLFDIDLTTDLDASDLVWFTAKTRKSDVDGDAQLSLTRGAGIVDVDTATGKAQVQVTKAQASTLTGRALVYDVKVKKADSGKVVTAVMGVIRLVESTNKSAA